MFGQKTELKPEVKPFEQKWYGVKCYDYNSCTNYWLRDGVGSFYCWPVKSLAVIYAGECNGFGQNGLKYVAEEIK